MNKFIIATLWVALATALPNLGKSQDTSTIDKLLNYTLAPLDKSQVTTNFLAEKGTIIMVCEDTKHGTDILKTIVILNISFKAAIYSIAQGHGIAAVAPASSGATSGKPTPKLTKGLRLIAPKK